MSTTTIAGKTGTHTMGPWMVAGDGFVVGGEGDAPNADFVSLMRITAPCVSRQHVPLEGEREANARLIAAAPDLLVALRICRAIIGSGSRGARIRIEPEAIAQADAAIAKAEGCPGIVERMTHEPVYESAQWCGCDPGASYTCAQHRGSEVTR